MIIEHVFVTTLEADPALQLAADYLQAGGFAFQPTAAPAARSARAIEVTRGKKNAAKAKSVDELPQRMHVEWDRGRVTVAAAIEYFEQGAFTGSSKREPPPESPKVRPHVELMHAVVWGLEAMLVHRTPLDTARQPWAQAEARLREEARRKRRKRHIILWSILAAFLLLIALVVVLNMR